MSVVRMVLIKSLIHTFMQYQHPEIVFTTYVDNYELQSATVEQTSQALITNDVGVLWLFGRAARCP